MMFSKCRAWTWVGVIGAAALLFPSFLAAQEIPKALQPPSGGQKLLMPQKVLVALLGITAGLVAGILIGLFALLAG